MRENPWHVLHVIANHEKRVAHHLLVRSAEPYLPLYSERSRWSDRTVLLERPLFTGYVFVRFQPQARLAVISTPGVLRLLGNDERYLVSAAEIDRIREGLAKGCLLRPHLGIAVGTRVRIRRGVFEGIEGLVAEFRHQCSVILTLAAVQQSFTLEVDVQDIEILNKPLRDPAQTAMLAAAV